MQTEQARMRTQLSMLLLDMEIPRRRRALREEDIRWLNRNIGVMNHKHPNIASARVLIAELMKQLATTDRAG